MGIPHKFYNEAKDQYAELMLECVLKGFSKPSLEMVRQFYDGCNSDAALSQYLILCSAFVADCKDPNSLMNSLYSEAIEDANDHAREHIEQYRLTAKMELELQKARKEEFHRQYVASMEEVGRIEGILSLVENHLRARTS